MSCEYRGSVVSCKFLCQLCLFAISCVLMDNALRGRLVNGLDSREVSRFDSFLIAGLQRFIKTTDSSLQSGLVHAISEVFTNGSLRTLHSGLDVCQSISPPVRFARTVSRYERSTFYHKESHNARIIFAFFHLFLKENRRMRFCITWKRECSPKSSQLRCNSLIDIPESGHYNRGRWLALERNEC